MSRWRLTLDVADVFHDESLTIAQKGTVIAHRIQRHRWADENDYVCDLADQLAQQTNADDFDVIWDAIYDEADRDRVWVRTI
jgi:hypothetical protein